jgi:hypothetical protein
MLIGQPCSHAAMWVMWVTVAPTESDTNESQSALGRNASEWTDEPDNFIRDAKPS